MIHIIIQVTLIWVSLFVKKRGFQFLSSSSNSFSFSSSSSTNVFTFPLFLSFLFFSFLFSSILVFSRAFFEMIERFFERSGAKFGGLFIEG